MERSLRDWHVLVADDEPAVLASIRRYFERLGATVVVAADGTQARTRLRDRHFDLALFDVTMPGAGGYDILPDARAAATTRVVLMSGYAQESPSGPQPDAFLEKPFTQRVLAALIERLAAP